MAVYASNVSFQTDGTVDGVGGQTVTLSTDSTSPNMMSYHSGDVPATCTETCMYHDTGGATSELCYCRKGLTPLCIRGDGSLAEGPLD